MEWSQIPVYTTGIGSVASMGLLIFMAGEKGRRVLTPRTSLLSRRYSAWIVGKHSDLIASRKEQNLAPNRIVNHYIQHTNIKTEEELNRTLLRDVDTWLTPEEAVRHGIADIIQKDRKSRYPGIVTRDLARTLEGERREGTGSASVLPLRRPLRRQGSRETDTRPGTPGAPWRFCGRHFEDGPTVPACCPRRPAGWRVPSWRLAETDGEPPWTGTP